MLIVNVESIIKTKLAGRIMKTINISNFEDFHNLIHEDYSEQTIFRGVSKESYKLLPRIGRFKSHYPEDITIEMIELELFKRFKYTSISYLNHIPSKDIEWLFIAQHHGLPTRLMDWTSNPLVAAYFSVANEKSRDSAIYALKAKNYVFYEAVEKPFKNDHSFIISPPHLNWRFIAQKSLFTLHHKIKEPLKDIDLVNFCQCEFIDKIIIKKEFRKELRLILNHYGFNKATLFPDLDHLTNQITKELGK